MDNIMCSTVKYKNTSYYLVVYLWKLICVYMPKLIFQMAYKTFKVCDLYQWQVLILSRLKV